MDENGSIAFLEPRFRSDLVFHPSSEPRSSRPPESARGFRMKRKRAKHRENFPHGWCPRLIGDRGQSSSARFKRLPPVRLRRTRSFHAQLPLFIAEPTAAGRIQHRRLPPLPSPVFSPQYTSTSEQWRATTRRTTASAVVPYTSGKRDSYTWRATRRRRTFAKMRTNTTIEKTNTAVNNSWFKFQCDPFWRGIGMWIFDHQLYAC
jgi:hypothetical protein